LAQTDVHVPIRQTLAKGTAGTTHISRKLKPRRLPSEPGEKPQWAWDELQSQGISVTVAMRDAKLNGAEKRIELCARDRHATSGDDTGSV
jgi:hypothetical protein